VFDLQTPAPLLAMHMANELLTPSVAFGLIVLAAACLAVASGRVKAQLDPAQVPMMGVLGAFVFAAQMINFPILPGTSGHLGGGVLLAILLGPHAATLVMASILIVQCLIFQDGGLLALGANILNLGVIPCYLGYGLFRVIAGSRPSAVRLYASVFLATLAGMLAGAAAVPFEVALSGVLRVPFAKFLWAMIGLHLLVALGEALITFGVIVYLAKVRPQSLGPVADRLTSAAAGWSLFPVLASFLVVALLLGGVVSHLASESPDALESITAAEETPDNTVVEPNASALVSKVSDMQAQTALLPDYQWTSLSGVVGTLVTLFVVWYVGRVLRRKEASCRSGVPIENQPRP